MRLAAVIIALTAALSATPLTVAQQRYGVGDENLCEPGKDPCGNTLAAYTVVQGDSSGCWSCDPRTAGMTLAGHWRRRFSCYRVAYEPDDEPRRLPYQLSYNCNICPATGCSLLNKPMPARIGSANACFVARYGMP
jgi:hypothetical protein